MPAPPSPEENQVNPTSKKKMIWIISGIVLVVLMVLITTLYSDFLGAKVAPGRKFKILGPSTIQAGQTATITWDISTEIAKRYPYEKIEYCYGKLLKRKCVVLASSVPNNGKAVVKVPASLPVGKGNLKFTARDPKKKLFGSLTGTSGTVTVKPAVVVSNDGGGSGGGGGGGGSGGSGGGGGGGGSGGGSNPTPTPSTAGVHISYFDNPNQDLKFATNTSGSWLAGAIDSGDAVGDNSELAIDGQGKAHISYYDRSNADLKYITSVSGTWVPTVVDSAGVTGLDTSIAVDSNGKIHISYFDAWANFANGTETADLNYATNASGSWVVTTIDSNGRVGEHSSIAIDGNDKVHISYYDAATANQDLKYANNTSGSWVVETIDTESGAGPYSSIAVDSQNKVHIAYVTYTGVPTPDTVLLRYITNSSGSWATTTVDATGFAQYASLALDTSNKAHIGYYDVIAKDVRYATNTSGSWATSTVDSTGDVGQFLSLALDSQGKLHLSYYDQTNADLKYATNTSGSWATTAVDSTGVVGSYTSIGVSQ